MSKFILGIGSGKTIKDLVKVFDKHIRKQWGIPLKVRGNSLSVEIEAERPQFDAEFESFTIRFHGNGAVKERVDEVVRSHSGSCSLTEEGEWHVVACRPEQQDGQDVETALNELSKALDLPQVWHIEGDRYRSESLSVELLFKAMVQYKASDLHLTPGHNPVFRVDNRTQFSEVIDPPSATQILSLIEEMAPEKDWKEFQELQQTSFSFHQAGLGYARVSGFITSGAPHLTLRFLPETIPSFEELSVPPQTMESLANLHRGLVLITGMTGSGKTTTVAALVDWINSHRACHILTIENPVEYVFQNKRAVISQRELGRDIGTFNEAVRGALRHDPDVIVIGEMRDPDTIRSAISAASTGHLVLSTLHANTASEVVNRIVSFFDPVERDLVRLQLRDSLQCVLCQRLVPRKESGRIPALEIMFNDIKPISDGIIMGDTDAIRIGMQQTASHSILFEEYLHQLYREGQITVESAREFASQISVFDQILMGTYSVPRLDSLKKH